VSFIDSEIFDSTAVNNGGVISLGHDRMILNIENCTITNSKSLNGAGGFLLMSAGYRLNIKDSKIKFASALVEGNLMSLTTQE